MKKFFILIILVIFCLSINCVAYAEHTILLEDPIIQFDRINDYGLQGYSVIKDKLFLVLEGYDDTKSIIKVYDLNTYEEIISYNYGSLGHANDVTYNSKTNKIYVIASSGSDIVFTFNGDTFEYENKFSVGLPIRSIAYLEDYDKYAVRTFTSGFIYDNEFKLNNKLPFVVGMNFSPEIGRQGWAYYNQLIYYANWSWIRLGGDGANIIYVYDLNGDKLDNIYTSNDIGELEGVDFYNSKMILGFNGYDKKIKFYLSDVPKIEIATKDEEIKVKDVEIVEKQNYTLYIVLGIGFILFIIIIFIIFRNKKKVSLLN